MRPFWAESKIHKVDGSYPAKPITNMRLRIIFSALFTMAALFGFYAFSDTSPGDERQPLPGIELTAKFYDGPDIVQVAQVDIAKRFDVERISMLAIATTQAVSHPIVLPPARAVTGRLPEQPISTLTLRESVTNGSGLGAVLRC